MNRALRPAAGPRVAGIVPAAGSLPGTGTGPGPETLPAAGAVRVTGILLVVALLACGACGTSLAIPRFSARYQQTCGLCHMNPTGGGERTVYASQVLVPSELSYQKYTAEQLMQIDPQIGKNLVVGFDGRTIYHKGNKTIIGVDNFIHMEGDVDLTFQIDPRFLAYVDRGLTQTPEAFGVGYILPWAGYVKVGRFYPAFGWRFDDHTAFTRMKALHATSDGSDLDGPPNFDYDTGLEAGVFPGRLSLIGAVLNGSFAGTPDNNSRVALSAQGLGRGHVGPVGFGAGGSFWNNDEPDAMRTAYGPYGYLTLGPATWVGEADWTWSRPPGTTSPLSILVPVTHFTTSHELSFVLRRGVTLRGTYDFFDPDVRARTGTRARYGIGADFMPYPFAMVMATMNFHRFQRGAVVTGTNYNMLELQVHIFY